MDIVTRAGQARHPVNEDKRTRESVQPIAPVVFYEDFLTGAGAFTARDTGAATETIAADAANGVFRLALDATNEVQVGGIDFNDQRPFVLNQGLVFETRISFPVLPTGAVVACWGLCGDWNAAVNSVAESIWFRADGSGVVTVETDDGTSETSQVATGRTLVADQAAVCRIDCGNPAAIRFYIDGVQVAASTTFRMDAVPALKLQPVLRIGKQSAATSVGTLDVDYVRLWQRRSA